MTIALVLITLIAVGYQIASLAASLRHAFRGPCAGGATPPVSILKPVHGLDHGFEAAVESHAAQDYPEFEILFGVHTLDDPAIPAINALIARHPERRIALIHCPPNPVNPAPNAKVGTLSQLIQHAHYDTLLINDSDILVPNGYLKRAVAPLEDQRIGLVTCIYRAVASSLAGRWEALGIATDFIPSTLVAPMVGIKEFGLGSTLVFRRSSLEQIGGFEAVRDYIADDYQLARRITATGKRAHISEVVVETHLGNPSFGAVWRHQVRWARTIRVSRGDGYIGLPVTHAGVWALVCLIVGAVTTATAPELTTVSSPLGTLSVGDAGAAAALANAMLATLCAILILLARIASALAAAIALRDPRTLAFAWLAPVWDLFAFVVWIAGWSGSAIYWRGARMTLTRDGRLVPASRS